MKNKIAIVCNSINTDLVKYFYCKIDVLVENGYQDNILILKNKNINLYGMNIYNSSFAKSAFFDIRVILDFLVSFYIFFIVIMKNVKVIHFTTAHISNIFLSILLKPFKIKQIFTIHDLIPHPGKKAFFISLYNKVVIIFLANEIIVFSKREQRFNKKFKYMRLGGFNEYINVPKIGERTILFFGRIESYKGLDNLLEIIKMANELKLNYKFIIAGKGRIDNIKEFEKNSNVRIFNRFINEKELLEIFKETTFTILPYNSATQSGVCILSYAYATPIIAYDIGSLGEYIENGVNGFLVPYKNNDKIINILKYINDKDIYRLSFNTIQVFKLKYSEDAFKKQFLEYYLKITEEST